MFKTQEEPRAVRWVVHCKILDTYGVIYMVYKSVDCGKTLSNFFNSNIEN